MKSFNFAAVIAVIVGIFSCSPMKIHSDKDSGTDFSKYKTYAWVQPTGKPPLLYAGFMEHTTAIELAKKGMVLDDKNPDAVFIFETKLEARTEYVQSPTVGVGVGFGGPGYYAGFEMPVAGGEITAQTYHDGMLMVSMYDTKSKKLIWWGSAEESVEMSDDIEKKIQQALHYMFYKFPKKRAK